jgi:hypothetical protein
MAAWQIQSPPAEDWWLRLLEISGAGLLGFVSALMTNRARFLKLETLIAGEKEKREAHEEKIAADAIAFEKRIDALFAELKVLIRDGKDNAAVGEQRRVNETNVALNAIRTDNNEHHRENRERLRILREQMFTVLRLVVKVARVIPGMNQTEVDDANAHFIALEVERAD